MKKMLVIPALIAMLAVSCDSSGGSSGGGTIKEWGSEIEAEMTEYLGEVLPFVALNKSGFFHEYDEEDGYYYIGDDNKTDLMTDYAAMLVSEYNYQEMTDEYGDPYYTNGSVMLYAEYYEAGVNPDGSSYNAGNQIAACVDESGGGGEQDTVVVNSNTIVFGECNLIPSDNGDYFYSTFEGLSFELEFGGTEYDGRYFEPSNKTPGMRIYRQGGFFTVSAKSGNIKSIVFEWVKHNNSKSKFPSASACDVGTYDTSTTTWSGNSSEVTFSNTEQDGYWVMASISVTVG